VKSCLYMRWDQRSKLKIYVEHNITRIFLFLQDSFSASPLQNLDFALEQKFRNAFYKVFLVQIRRNFGKYILKFVFKANKKNTFKIFVQRQNQNFKVGVRGGQRNLHITKLSEAQLTKRPNDISLFYYLTIYIVKV
jgi:hypothetical protein